MPTLTRFARIVALTAGIALAVLYALATLVEPRTRTMTEPIDTRIIRDAGRAPDA